MSHDWKPRTYLENGFQLLQLHLGRKQRLANDELRKNAAHSPTIDAWTIPRCSQQKFRWSIPQRDYTVGEIRRRVTQTPGETKVRQLGDTTRTEIAQRFRQATAVPEPNLRTELLNPLR